jgi:Na+/serine symporter
MPQEVTLTFNHEEDEGLNLTGTVNFPNAVDIHGVTNLSIRGLAEWRHVPSNIVHVNQTFIERFGMMEKSKNLSKVGMNWIGIQARTDILLGFALRHGRNGTKRVQDLLTKFFKALGASSVKFSILDVEAINEDDLD